MRKELFFGFTLVMLLLSCKNKNEKYDASGSFEADEVIVSSELNGQLLNFTVEEGAPLTKGQVVGIIDAENMALQKEQVEASIESLPQKTADVEPQVKMLQDQLNVQKSQMSQLVREKVRTERLIKADAATGKQLDDLNSQIDQLQQQMDVTRQQINVQRNVVQTQNRSILSEKPVLEKKVAQLEQQISKSKIINPTNGVVLTKYAEQGEITAAGKALYKVADLSYLTLRAYLTGNQLPVIKLNQPVTVLVDNGDGGYKEYPGTISWISDQAEFTPKSIQTKEERANLVYAVKIHVKNDGYLKIGMYADVRLQNQK